MGCTARVPGLDNQAFALGIPETIGCRQRMILNFPEVDVPWDGPDDEGAVRCQWTTAGRIRYSALVVPFEDHVDVEMTITNLGEEAWHDVFAFNCLNPVRAEQFKDWELERTYMSRHGRTHLMKNTTRVKGHMPTVGFYLHEQTPWGKESPFVRGFHATSPDRTDDSWIVTLSDPPGAYMAATSVDSLFLFDNLDRCCIHSAPSFGDIGPGQSSTTVCRLYLAKGDLDAFLKRYDEDREELASRQKWANPKRPRIELRPVPPPAQGELGLLAFQIRAPWQKGWMTLRFPETLRTSLGLHFIDHRRRDMPPRSMLDPMPAWQVNERTGEIRYEGRTPEGVEFSGRARPYDDEIVLEYRVKNESGSALSGAHVQMCLSLAGAEGLEEKHDVRNAFTWVDGRSRSFADMTPAADEKGRAPWLLIETSPAKPRARQREHEDGWWFVDQVADHGVIARVTDDRKHLVAIHWGGGTGLMTNSRIPCLHAGPSALPPLEPGEEGAWRGKILLMNNDPAALLTRYRGDTGEWPYPERKRRAR
jgi:hypothetical protein